MFASITPGHAVRLFGRSGRAAVSSEIATPLEANLILLPTAKGYCGLIGLDTLFASTAFKAAVLAALPSVTRGRIEELIFVASHTHNAPALDPTKPALGTVDDAYFNAAAQTVADLIERTLAGKMASIQRVFRGSSECHLNAGRRQKGLRLSTKPPFLSFEMNMAPRQGRTVPRAMDMTVAYGSDGAPLWAIWSWCCHATAFPDQQAISPDFPGHVRDQIRVRLGDLDLPIVFLPGFCGDVKADPSVLPISLKSLVRLPFCRPFAVATAKNYGKLCSALTAAVHKMVDGLRPVATAPIASIARADMRIGDLLVGEQRSANRLSSDVCAISMGDFGLVLVGAEVCSPYLAMLTPVLPATWMTSGYADDVFGYLPTDDQIVEGGYESVGFFSAFSVPGKFSPQIEQVVLKTWQSAINQAMEAARRLQ